MLGTQFKVPTSVAESGLIRVVGRERNDADCRVKHQGSGKEIYHCVEVVDGETRGTAFAVGSDELVKREKTC